MLIEGSLQVAGCVMPYLSDENTIRTDLQVTHIRHEYNIKRPPNTTELFCRLSTHRRNARKEQTEEICSGLSCGDQCIETYVEAAWPTSAMSTRQPGTKTYMCELKNEVSSFQDCSKHFTAPGRPVQSNTISTSQGNIQPQCN